MDGDWAALDPTPAGIPHILEPTNACGEPALSPLSLHFSCLPLWKMAPGSGVFVDQEVPSLAATELPLGRQKSGSKCGTGGAARAGTLAAAGDLVASAPKPTAQEGRTPGLRSPGSIGTSSSCRLQPQELVLCCLHRFWWVTHLACSPSRSPQISSQIEGQQFAQSTGPRASKARLQPLGQASPFRPLPNPPRQELAARYRGFPEAGPTTTGTAVPASTA